MLNFYLVDDLFGNCSNICSDNWYSWPVLELVDLKVWTGGM